jgi:hypothetical protein
MGNESSGGGEEQAGEQRQWHDRDKQKRNEHSQRMMPPAQRYVFRSDGTQYGSHMSTATAWTDCFCSGLNVPTAGQPSQRSSLQ